MSPLAPPPLHQSAPCPPPPSDAASSLELTLVSLALLTSAVLTLIPSTHSRVHDHAGSLPITLVSLLAACLALAVSALALILGWTRAISLDALATVVFALVPALLSMPLANIEFAWVRFRMARFKSLYKTYSNFSYLSYAAPCAQSHIRPAESPQMTDGSPREDFLIVRYFPRRRPFLFKFKYVHAPSALEAPAKKSADESSNHVAKGSCLQHHPHYTVLENFNMTSEVRWWRSVSSSTAIVARPWLVHLNTPDASMQALALLTDIIAIGRLVLKHRSRFLEEQVTKCECIRKDMRRTAGVVCNVILEQTGLQEWGRIDDSIFSDDYAFPEERCKRYGLLFIVLTIESDVYSNRRYDLEVGPYPMLEKADWRMRYGLGRNGEVRYRKPSKKVSSNDVEASEGVFRRLSAATVLQRLQECKLDREGFKDLERTEVDRWLRSWGCDIDVDSHFRPHAVGFVTPAANDGIS